jgi:hypothetical protein
MNTVTITGTSSADSAESIDSAAVEMPACWLTWVGATAGCLNALGIDCDLADVAGQTGYAFRMIIGRELCPSGPTAFPWESLLPGVQRLGRSTLCFHAMEPHCPQTRNARTDAHAAAAMEIVRREIADRRPCVINGAYLPEFAIVTGVERNFYRVETFKRQLRQEQPPVRFDEVNAPGGIYVLSFPTETAIPPPAADRAAIVAAVEIMRDRPADDRYAYGADAFEAWARWLEDERAMPFGNAYNAQCWAEARRLAERFVGRVAARNEAVAEPLVLAQASLTRCADLLARVAILFPFHGKHEITADARREATDLLRQARYADAKALTELEMALDGW